MIFWLLDKLLDVADWLAGKLYLQHEGHSDHFKHPFDPPEEQYSQQSLLD